jgi:RNA-directed DNA polymerase
MACEGVGSIHITRRTGKPYGVFGNFDSLKRYYHEALGIVFKWHNRRSQYRSKTWQGFKELLKHFKVPRPCIVECLFESKAA